MDIVAEEEGSRVSMEGAKRCLCEYIRVGEPGVEGYLRPLLAGVSYGDMNSFHHFRARSGYTEPVVSSLSFSSLLY